MMNLLPHVTINILLFLLYFPYASSVSFNIHQFNATATNIIYEGDAESVGGVVELTNKVQYVGRVGRATYAERIPFWDSHNEKFSDFKTNFSFLIDKKGQETYGSGFAFYLAPWGYPIPLNSGGGFLGLFNKTASGYSPDNKVVLVEFDYYVDDEWDPKYQHIGINTNSIASDVCARWNVNLHDGEVVDVSINYNATEKNLTVYWSYKNNLDGRRGELTSLSYIIDLAKILPEWISVGFSAGTSQYDERHKILSWQFYSSLDGVFPPYNRFLNAIRIVIIIVLALITAVIALKTAELWWRELRRIIRNRIGIATGVAPDESDLSSIFDVGDDDIEAGSSRRQCDPVAPLNLLNDESTLIDVDIAMRTTDMNQISSFNHPNLVELNGRCHDRGPAISTQ